MSSPQNYGSHARWRPLFHFVIIPLLLTNLGLAIAYNVHCHWRHVHLGTWWIVMAVVLLLMAADARNSALKAQDRIIRLEERLRLTALGVPQTAIVALTERQLIGLRFASDAEVVLLAERALGEKLTEKQIKASVQSWRADHFRV